MHIHISIRIINKMDFIDDFIEEYKNNPCLWKADSIHFKNRVKRQEAYNKLIDVASKHGEHYNVERTKQKINNLRCAFRHQLKKYLELKNKEEKDEPYCPKRRYFESLMFLKDEENIETKRKRKNTNTFDSEIIKNSLEVESISNRDDKIKFSEVISDKVDSKSSNPDNYANKLSSNDLINRDVENVLVVDYNEHSVNISFNKQDQLTSCTSKDQTELQMFDFEKELPTVENVTQDHRRKRSCSVSIGETIDKVEDVSEKNMKVDFSPIDLGKLLNIACKSAHSETEDNFSNYGKVIAHKLRSMDKTQAMYAEKIIGDVIFHGQMKLLTILSINRFACIESCNANDDTYHGN